MDSGKIPNVTFTIDWKDGIENPEPISLTEYPMSATHKAEVQRQLDLLLKHGYIRRSHSPW